MHPNVIADQAEAAKDMWSAMGTHDGAINYCSVASPQPQGGAAAGQPLCAKDGVGQAWLTPDGDPEE